MLTSSACSLAQLAQLWLAVNAHYTAATWCAHGIDDLALLCMLDIPGFAISEVRSWCGHHSQPGCNLSLSCPSHEVTYVFPSPRRRLPAMDHCSLSSLADAAPSTCNIVGGPHVLLPMFNPNLDGPYPICRAGVVCIRGTVSICLTLQSTPIPCSRKGWTSHHFTSSSPHPSKDHGEGAEWPFHRV